MGRSRDEELLFCEFRVSVLQDELICVYFATKRKREREKRLT